MALTALFLTAILAWLLYFAARGMADFRLRQVLDHLEEQREMISWANEQMAWKRVMCQQRGYHRYPWYYEQCLDCGHNPFIGVYSTTSSSRSFPLFSDGTNRNLSESAEGRARR